jgi:hypothetical protein
MGHLQYVIPGFTADIEDVDMRISNGRSAQFIYDHRTVIHSQEAIVEKPGKPVNDGVREDSQPYRIIQAVHHTARFDAVIEHRHVLISNDTANWFEYPLLGLYGRPTRRARAK